MPYISSAAPGAGGDGKDPCAHKKNNKKKYMVYMASEGKDKMYVGRSSGELTKSAKSILAGRLSTGYPAGKKYAERKIKQLVPVHETELYSAMRGAEEKHQKFFARNGIGAAQDNPINPKHKDKQNYEDCAKKTFPNCPICSV